MIPRHDTPPWPTRGTQTWHPAMAPHLATQQSHPTISPEHGTHPWHHTLRQSCSPTIGSKNPSPATAIWGIIVYFSDVFVLSMSSVGYLPISTVSQGGPNSVVVWEQCQETLDLASPWSPWANGKKNGTRTILSTGDSISWNSAIHGSWKRASVCSDLGIATSNGTSNAPIQKRWLIDWWLQETSPQSSRSEGLTTLGCISEESGWHMDSVLS